MNIAIHTKRIDSVDEYPAITAVDDYPTALKKAFVRSHGIVIEYPSWVVVTDVPNPNFLWEATVDICDRFGFNASPDFHRNTFTSSIWPRWEQLVRQLLGKSGILETKDLS